MADVFSGKLCLITGGSSGIGLALAEALAARGARLGLLARGVERLEAALARVRERSSLPSEAHSILVCDVTDRSVVEHALAAWQQTHGVPDLVINSAGGARPGYFWELPPEVFEEMMAVNYFGTVYVCRAVTPGMIARGSGHMVNIASVAAFLGVFGYTAYGASKYAVRGFSETLRAELRPHGVFVSLVFPPDTDTPQLAEENRYKPPETKALSSTAGVLSPQEVAAAILRGVARRQALIFPGREARLLWLLSRLLGAGVYPIMDWLIARAQRSGRRG